MHIYNCEKIRHRQRYKAVAIDSVICPPKNKANITYNKATVKNKANIRQFWGVVKIRQTARNTPISVDVLLVVISFLFFSLVPTQKHLRRREGHNKNPLIRA